MGQFVMTMFSATNDFLGLQTIFHGVLHGKLQKLAMLNNEFAQAVSCNMPVIIILLCNAIPVAPVALKIVLCNIYTVH